jgi:hypothetical protein
VTIVEVESRVWIRDLPVSILGGIKGE